VGGTTKMLDGLRKKQKSIIWIIAIIFVAGMAVMGITSIFQPKPYVGVIYGKKITLQEYDTFYRNYLNNYRQQNPDATLDDQTLQNLNDQAWNQFVSMKVFERSLKRNRIKVKDSEIVAKYKSDPPAELKQNPSFQVNGVFDFPTYMEIIRNNPDFARSLEEYIRQTLPYEKLERKIKDQVVVTEDSVRVDWLTKNERASGRVINFDWNTIPATEVTEDEIAAYYAKHTDKYKKGATRKYRYVNIPIAPSAEDSLRAKTEIDEYYNLILRGEDFGVLAEQYSQDPGSAQNMGSLGFFGKGRMVPEFESVAFDMNIGDIHEPILSQFGWHIIKVTDKKTNEAGEPEVEASHILIKIEASEATKMDLRYKADDLHDQATNYRSLEKAAELYGLKIEETNDFDEKSNYIAGIGRFQHLVTEAFKNKVGYLAEPVKLPDGAYVVAELADRQNESIQPLDQVTEAIKREVDKEKRMAAAREKAETIIAEATPEEYIDKAIEAGFKVADFNNILVTNSVPTIGVQKPLNAAIFQTYAGQWTGFITTDNGLYKAHVTSRNEPDIEVFNSTKEKLTADYRTQKENTHYQQWSQKAMEEAKAQDLRYKYY